MNRIERLVYNYENYVNLPWDDNLAGSQRVWFAVYDPADERRLRARITEFELATKRAEHGWYSIDLTDSFPAWMKSLDYSSSYFEDPEDLEMAMREFMNWLANDIRERLMNANENDVAAISGIAALFGFIRISDLIVQIESHIKGRLLVFFPGQYDNNNYRLLDARDGWNYLAVPISCNSWE